MKRKSFMTFLGIFLFLGLMFLGCESLPYQPSFSSLPVTNSLMDSVKGSWIDPDGNVYVFREDGTGDLLTYRGGDIATTRAFRYRMSDKLFGFSFLDINNDYVNPYVLSGDGQQIIFPQTEYAPNTLHYRRVFTKKRD